ncbi:Hypothetical_protein [Hexamita inflata]|uniref:Hypothetical_protein n=1 Tax=Hexamita inflata TaxID=28002 RepID=A0AA86QRI7_9EUKA|nr:Hypothetical protein HINF_LOCUS46972 [Hexamita inflata]
MLQYGIDFIHPTIFHSSTFPTVIPKIFSLLSTLKSDVLTDTTYQYNTLSIKHNIFDLNAISFAQNYNSQIFGFLEKVEQIGYSSDDLYLLDINLHHFTILQNISNVQTERTNRALFRLLYSFKILNIFSNYIDLFFKKKSRYWLAHSFSEQEISGFLPYKSGKQKYVTSALIIFYCFHSDSFKLRQANAHHVQHSCYDNHVNEITTFIHRFKDIGRVSTEEKKTSRNDQNLLSWNQLCRLKGTISWLDDLYNAFVNGWYRRESQELLQVLKLVNLNVILVRKHPCSSQTHRASLNRLFFVKEEYRLVRTRPADFNQSWSLLVV